MPVLVQAIPKLAPPVLRPTVRCLHCLLQRRRHHQSSERLRGFLPVHLPYYHHRLQILLHRRHRR